MFNQIFLSLVLIYGSYVNGTANSKSDVDCYYIPKSECGYDLAVDFMIEGVGYDIYPISWERVEKIADLLENMSPPVGDVNIIYSNSADDVERFKTMQARLKRNLLNDNYVKEIAARRCEEAGCPVYELLSNFNYKELDKLSETTQRIENDLVQLITDHGGYIKQYDSFEQFESAKL